MHWQIPDKLLASTEAVNLGMPTTNATSRWLFGCDLDVIVVVAFPQALDRVCWQVQDVVSIDQC